MAKKVQSQKLKNDAVVAPAETVKVKILKHVGPYLPGQVVEVDVETASHLCHVNEIDNGIGHITKNVRAVYLEEFEELDAEMKKPENLTLAEAKALGVQNKVGAEAEESSEESHEELAEEKSVEQSESSEEESDELEEVE